MKNKQARHARMATAYHEAGHAVVAWQLGVSLRRRGVTIIPDGDRAGATHHHQVVGRDIQWNRSGRNRLKVETQMQICLAGPIAQHRYNPRSNRRWQMDLADCIWVDLLFDMADTRDARREVEAWIKLLWIRTENMLSKPDIWSAVQRLAEALIQREKLSGREATEIIRAGFNEGLIKSDA